MLVIHIISTEDTKDFSTIYDNLDATILINPSTRIAREAIVDERDTIVLIGHGTDYGLLNKNLNGYFIDSGWVNLLRNKTIIGIWCNASNFADRYDLTGFFTSMFISNAQELIDCGFQTFDNCDEVIRIQNQIFASRINQLLSANTPSKDWATILFDSLDNEERFVYYNYEAMYSTEER
jgi:hypothetical protein